MSKTAQRKRQAYQEGLKHGGWESGFAYSRHPFMADYRRGYRDGVARNRHRSKVVSGFRPSLIEKVFCWLVRDAS